VDAILLLLSIPSLTEHFKNKKQNRHKNRWKEHTKKVPFKNNSYSPRCLKISQAISESTETEQIRDEVIKMLSIH
jgi:hypothetical protein